MQSHYLRLILAAVFAAGALLLPAATRAEDDAPTGVSIVRPAGEDDARVRFVHAVPGPSSSPDLPVDIYLDTTLLAASVPFTTISDYFNFPPGNLTFRILLAGALPTDTPVAQATLNAVADGLYTCAANPDSPPAATISLTCITDSLGVPPGSARLAVYHFSRVVEGLSAAVDVRRADNDAVLIDDLVFGTSGFVNVPAGEYDLKLTTSTGADLPVRFDNVQVVGNLAYSLFAIGDPLTIGVPNTVVSANAKVRVIHAAVGAPNVDVYVDGNTTPLLRDVQFFEVSDYLDVAPGTYTFRIFQAGQGSSGTPLLFTPAITVEPGKAYTAVARGDAANLASLGVNLYNDDLNSPTPGTTKVRVFHLSPGAPSVSLARNGQAIPGVTLSFGQASSYLEVPSGLSSLQALVAGGPSNGVVALNLPNVETFGEQVADIFVIDLPARLTAEIRLTDTDTAFRIVHASPAAGNVDVYLANQRILTNVPLGTIGGYRFEQPGLYQVRVFATGANPASATPAINAYLTFAPGEKYTVAARNQGAGVQAVVFEDNARTAPRGFARVNVYHLSPTIQTLSAGGVDVDVIGGAKLVDNLRLDEVQTVDVPVGSYSVRITSSTGSATIVPALPVVAPGRYVYDLFAIDQVLPANPTVVSRESFPADVPVYELRAPVVLR